MKLEPKQFEEARTWFEKQPALPLDVPHYTHGRRLLNHILYLEAEVNKLVAQVARVTADMDAVAIFNVKLAVTNKLRLDRIAELEACLRDTRTHLQHAYWDAAIGAEPYPPAVELHLGRIDALLAAPPAEADRPSDEDVKHEYWNAVRTGNDVMREAELLVVIKGDHESGIVGRLLAYTKRLELKHEQCADMVIAYGLAKERADIAEEGERRTYWCLEMFDHDRRTWNESLDYSRQDSEHEAQLDAQDQRETWLRNNTPGGMVRVVRVTEIRTLLTPSEGGK